MNSIKHQLLAFFSDIGKSASDVDYYRISPWSLGSSLIGKSNNIFDFMIILDELSNASLLALGIIVFHDNTWILYDVSESKWDYMKPPSYDELMNIGKSNGSI